MGTDPTSSNSVLAVEAPMMTPAGDPVLSWPTAPGRKYSVQVSTDLSAPGSGFSSLVSNLPSSVHSYTDTVNRGSAVFYRIEVTR